MHSVQRWITLLLLVLLALAASSSTLLVLANDDDDESSHRRDADKHKHSDDKHGGDGERLSDDRFDRAQKAAVEARDAAEEAVHSATSGVTDAARHAQEVIQETVEPVVTQVREVLQTTESKVKQAAPSLSPSPSFLTKIQRQLSSAARAVGTKSKRAVDRCKNLNQGDVKKVAAAALGVWGVAVGVGYLTTQNTPATGGGGRKK